MFCHSNGAFGNVELCKQPILILVFLLVCKLCMLRNRLSLHASQSFIIASKPSNLKSKVMAMLHLCTFLGDFFPQFMNEHRNSTSQYALDEPDISD